MDLVFFYYLLSAIGSGLGPFFLALTGFFFSVAIVFAVVYAAIAISWIHKN